MLRWAGRWRWVREKLGGQEGEGKLQVWLDGAQVDADDLGIVSIGCSEWTMIVTSYVCLRVFIGLQHVSWVKYFSFWRSLTERHTKVNSPNPRSGARVEHAPERLSILAYWADVESTVEAEEENMMLQVCNYARKHR